MDHAEVGWAPFVSQRLARKPSVWREFRDNESGGVVGGGSVLSRCVHVCVYAPAVATAPGSALRRLSATMYTFCVAGSFTLTYLNFGFTHSATLLRIALSTRIV